MKKSTNLTESRRNNIDWGLIFTGLILLAISLFITVAVVPNFVPKDEGQDKTTLEDSALRFSTTVDKEEINRGKSSIDQDLKKEKLVFDLYNNLAKVDIYPNGLDTPPGLIQYCQDEKATREKCNQEVIKLTQTISTKPTIAEAYLYVKVAVSRGGQPFGGLTKYDSIYFFLDDSSKFGGHLLRSKSVWSKENTDNTELLFDLKGLPFTDIPYKDAVTPIKMPDLLDVLNEGGNHYIVSFVSTLGAGRIQEMKIGYRSGEITFRR